MAESITWRDLLAIYENTDWGEGKNGNLKIANASILATLQLVEESDLAQHESDVSLLSDIQTAQIGQVLAVQIGSPLLRLGVLADDWDSLIASPESRLVEKDNYYIKSANISSKTTTPPDRMLRYRAMVKFVDLIAKASLFVDRQRSLLVFFKNHRIEIPVTYSANDLNIIDANEIDDLDKALQGDIHSEQRLAILGDTIMALVESQPLQGRFLYLAQNVSELTKRVKEGYKLFASSFSYTKIKNDIEAAQSEYIARIHKTFVDIQGQLLALPVATVVVATQLRVAKECGVEAFANIAVLVGAALFALLLIASCLNQWFTLNAISQEIGRQKTKLDSDFKEIKETFQSSFTAINERICWHRFALIVISLIAAIGALFAYRVFATLTQVDAWTCLATN